jgi:cytosine-specific methyltransferase
MTIKTIGSVCSGIEAASLAWEDLDFDFKWFSEIAEFPSRLLKIKYPKIPNHGDMTLLAEKISNGLIEAPDLICGGTPCQAFSVAGWRNGLEDDRGNLTLSFVDIVEEADKERKKQGKNPSVVFWENVEGVLKDKTNAFGSFLASLAGFEDSLEQKKWPTAGIIRGPKRNIAWRVLDAKYFGVPQQRRRVYVLAGGKDFFPEDTLFEIQEKELPTFKSYPLHFQKDGIEFEVFREYTDVIYAAYGTKWNGNAAAYNGSLFISQNNKLRRLSPLECERLMGFPDNYTNIKNSKLTQRYQALGNSWAVPVIKWIGNRMVLKNTNVSSQITKLIESNHTDIFLFSSEIEYIEYVKINYSSVPNQMKSSSLVDIVDTEAPSNIFLSPVACAGILRRKQERNLRMNSRLEILMQKISNTMSEDEIEKKSRVQKRGAYSEQSVEQLKLF